MFYNLRLLIIGLLVAIPSINANAVPITSGLVKYLPFDNSIDNFGSLSEASLLKGTAHYTTGKLGQAAQFLNNGSGNTTPSDWAVSLGQLNSIYDKSFTVSLWLKTNSTSDTALMGNKNWSSGSNVGWVLATTTNKNLNWNTVNGSRNDISLVFNDGNWHLVTLVFNRTSNKVLSYIDGVLKNTTTLAAKATASLNPNPVLNTLIGSSGTGTWAGKADIDEVAVWSRALPATDIAQLIKLAGQGTSLAVQQTLEATAPVLTASSQSKRVVLQWTSSQVALGTVTYSIFRNGTKVADTSSLTYNDLNLTPNTAYQYRIDAVAGGKTLSSNVLNVTTTNHAPTFWGMGGHYVVVDGSAVGTIVGDSKASDLDVDDTVTYSLVKGTGIAVNASTGAISITTPPKRSAATQQVFTIAASDGIATVQKQFKLLIVNANQLTHNGVTRQLWNNIGGSAVTDLSTNGRYPKQFDSSDTLTTLTAPVNIADNYGQRLSGYLRAPKTGKYTFWIASDDASELRLAANTDPATLSASPLAFVSGWTNVNTWNTEPNQKSLSVNLVKGQYYFIEVLHKEGGGGDHAEVVWQAPAMTAPVAIDSSLLLTADALDSVPPSSPSLAVSQISSSGVSLAWNNSQDNSSIANYLIYRDKALIATLANNLHSFTDTGVTGIHDYSVVAVDSYGNRSIATVLKAVDSSQTMDAVEQAISSGDASPLVDATALINKALSEITKVQASDVSKLSAFYPAGTSISYSPSNNSQWIIPNADNEQLMPLLLGNKGNSLAIAGKAQGTRFAAFGSIPTATFQAGNTTYIEPFKRVLAWLLTGSASSTSSLAGIHNVALTYANSASSTRTWLTTQQFANSANQWTVTDCNTAATLASCYGGKELLIVGRSANDTDAPAITAAIKTALKNGTPVLYLHPDWGTNALSDSVSALLGFSMPYGGNWWANDAASWTDVNAMYAQVAQAQGYPPLTKLLTHFKNQDWNLNLSACSDNSCNAADLKTEFYAGARDSLRQHLNAMDSRNVDLFSLSGQRLNKMLVLLGDVFRRDIHYPLDKRLTPQDSFLRAYYADHAVYYSRSHNAVQNDLGSFSKPIPASVPLYSKDLNLTTRTDDYFTAAGAYAVPAQTFTVERLDNSTQPVKIAINTLRSGSTHEFDSYSYSRPKYLQSPWINIKAGQKLTLSSPHGGTLQVWLQNSATPINVQLRFNQVGQHPVWNGSDTTQAFKDGIAKGDYDWVEFLTPNFQLHSTRAHIIETLANPLYSTPEALADVTWNYFYRSIFNLAGFTGQDLSLNNTVAAFCSAKAWDCTNPLIHGMFSILHFNSDQATCGYGCSGNPYDAYWSFDPLGWGDAHETGHNLQRGRLKIDDGASTEVSNNIFPTHTVYSWNKDHPTNLQHTGHNPDQAAIFNFLNTAALQATPVSTVHQNLWVNGDVFWRLEFYRQLALQSYYLPQFGDGGWDIFTLLYLQERLFTQAINSDSAWTANKDKLGFSLYDKATANAINGNDYMLIATSFITGKDQRAFFDLWGVPYSITASNQVANYGYTNAEKRFYVLPKDSNGYWGSLDPVASVLVNGTNKLP
ncbi:MAG: ImpA family metalloprotease [Methylococcaceae bacterium]